MQDYRSHGRGKSTYSSAESSARVPGNETLTSHLQLMPATSAIPARPAEMGRLQLKSAGSAPRPTGQSFVNSIYSAQGQRRGTAASAGPASLSPAENKGSGLNEHREDPVQQAGGEAPSSRFQQAAAAGIQGSGGSLPHLEKIQASFGKQHDVSRVVAHVGGIAADACASMGASAYATGNHVGFAGPPDLHTAAHEAAHVVQQRRGVHLHGGVGAVGDEYERNADAVADRVVTGRFAGDLLGGPSRGEGGNDVGQGKSAQSPLDQMANGGAVREGSPVIQRQPALQAGRGYDEGEVCLPPEEMVCEAPPEEMVCETQPQAGHDREMGAGDYARSVGEHVTRTALHEAALREMYHRGEQAITAEAEAMLRAGQSEQAVARWSNEARNNLRRAIRQQGEPIIDQIARTTRGARDMPSYESLRARGRTDAQIIESAARSNAGVNRWVGRIRIAGRILIAIDIGIAVYTVASAPSVDRPRVMAREAGRLGGALAGGWGGAEGGAAIGTFFGPWGIAIGGVLGGVGGAIGGAWAGGEAAEWAIEQFYPPEETRFEEGNR